MVSPAAVGFGREAVMRALLLVGLALPLAMFLPSHLPSIPSAGSWPVVDRLPLIRPTPCFPERHHSEGRLACLLPASLDVFLLP